MYKFLISILFSLLISIPLFSQAEVDLFIIAGQSNVNGRGLVNNLSKDEKTQEAMFFGSWHKFSNNASAADINPQLFSGWCSQTIAGETRNDGNISENFGGSAWFGPEVGFAARANEIKISANPVAIIKYAVDGSAINNSVNPQLAGTTSDWDTNASGEYAGDCWRGFKIALDKAIADLPAGNTPNFKGMVWWQGESGTNAAALNTFIGEVRSHLATNYGVQNAKDFPVVITGSFAWGADLKAGVSDLDDDIGYIDPNDFGQGGWSNIHLGSGENGQSLDVDNNGINDMFDIGKAFADEINLLIDSDEDTGDPEINYEITFVNVDGTQEVQKLAAGEFAIPPAGVDTEDKTFTAWPNILVASSDFTYTAHYISNDPPNSNASVSVILKQSINSGAGTTSIDLTDHGDLNWAAWNGGNANPNEQMLNGLGFLSMTAIGGTQFANGSFRGQNLYSWTNGAVMNEANTNLSGSASINADGDGVRLAVDLDSAGTYQLKFYASTYDLNLDASASLSSGEVVGTAKGNYVANSVQKYEYTIDFTSEGPDTLTLDMIKNGGGSFIFAQEAFSLKSVSLSSPPSPNTYEITFVNVDGASSMQLVNEGERAIPPVGVDTEGKIFTSWPSIATAKADVTYRALYTEPLGDGDIVDVFISTGQSNAYYPLNSDNSGQYAFGHGIQDALIKSEKFSNPRVVIQAEPGRPIAYWWAEFISPVGPNIYYDQHFFNTTGTGPEGALEAKINEIKANGDRPRFRGVFWWQGESDGIGAYASADTSKADYEMRWDGILTQLDADLNAAGMDTSDYRFVVNTVAESGDKINEILKDIAMGDERGVVFDTQVAMYHGNSVIVEAAYGALHDYNHYSVGEANAQIFIDTFVESPPSTVKSYEITFVNVDGAKTTETVKEGVVLIPPPGVNSANKRFTSWPTIVAASEDVIYTALYITNKASDESSSVLVHVEQSEHGSANSASVDLSEHGDLDWAAWDGGAMVPNQTMEGGSGFRNFNTIGNASINPGFFYGQNTYAWSNGYPSEYGSSSLSGSASINVEGDGVRLVVDLDSAGTYQLKFYASTYDLNLDATASLSSGEVVGTAKGSYVANSVQKYEYTINFTSEGPDTLTLDMIKNGGGSFIFAQEAFSLKSVSLSSPPSPNTYEITFVNVDGTSSMQLVNEGERAIPPVGVDTEDKIFTSWPSMATARGDATYVAVYVEVETPAEYSASWGGDAGDGMWSSPMNWDGNSSPNDSDDIYVGGESIITGALSNFASLLIDIGAYVSFASSFQMNKIFVIHGVLDLDTLGAFRPYGSLFHLSSRASFGSNVFWLDLGEKSLMSFEDGASFQSKTNIEVRGEISLDFQLSETGFQTLDLGGLWDAGSAGWKDFTFNIDVSKFSAESGTSLVLMDFSSHTQVFSGEFTPEINIINDQEELDVKLYFDTEKSQLILLVLSE